MDELELIQQRYQRRETSGVNGKYPAFSAFQHYMKAEREYWYSLWITELLGDPAQLKVLEVGAGAGDNIGFFRRLGVLPGQLWANELLPERVERLKNWLAPEQILTGDARQLNFVGTFDVVFQSTVFSSILDRSFAQDLAAVMWRALKPGGLILWYDFTYNNPNNPDVRGISSQEVCSHWPEAQQVRLQRVTLAPPLGRRVGRLYNYVNFPILRTHLVAAFTKGIT